MNSLFIVILGLLACAPEAPGPVPAPPPAPGPSPSDGPHFATATYTLTDVPPGPQRTIVLISLDTVSAPHLALYGGRAETPHLAQVAAAGVRFADAVTHFPQTCLSHWSMMTGVMPELQGNAPAHAGSLWTGPTLAEIAARHGYQTAAVVGGVTLQDRACGLSRGFQRFDDRFAVDPQDMRRPAAEVTAAALAALTQMGDQPGFLFVHYFDAHFPYTPPSPWDTRYDPDYTGTLTGTDAALERWRDGEERPPADALRHVEALYEGELSALDAALAPLLDAVPEDAVLVVTSDHGESFAHAPWFNHRGALWEDVLRVPLLIRAPGLTAGTVHGPQVGLIDVAPTILALAGLPQDTRMQGRSLPKTTSSTPIWSGTDPWLGPQTLSQREGLDGAKLLFLPEGSPLRFTLATDPTEQAGVPTDADAGAYAALLDGLRDQMEPAPAPRGVGPAERQQLEQLGYVDPTRPRPPHGKAPGRQRGPPGAASPPTR